MTEYFINNKMPFVILLLSAAAPAPRAAQVGAGAASAQSMVDQRALSGQWASIGPLPPLEISEFLRGVDARNYSSCAPARGTVNLCLFNYIFLNVYD